MSSGAYQLRLVRTLYQNVYGCMLYNENQQPIGQLEIVPNIPLDRSQVPEDAPEVPAYLLVIVFPQKSHTTNTLILDACDK